MAKLDLKIDFNTLQWGKLADAMKSAKTEKQLYRRGPVDDIDIDPVIPEAHFHYEHNSEPIVKITRAPHISCDDFIMPHYGESFDNLNKNLEFKERKFMNKINNVCGGSLIQEEAEKKLQKKFQEDGWLTRKDIWDALNVRVADARDYGKQKLTDIDDIRAAVKEIMDHCYLSNKLPFGLEPLKMWQTDNGYTTVEWTDGTTTSVSTEDGGHATLYGGFCACVVKKLYGSTGQAIKMMEHADKNAKWPAEKKRIKREKLKKIRQANAESIQKRQAKRREHLIEMHMEGIYAHREAERRVAEADARKEETK